MNLEELLNSVLGEAMGKKEKKDTCEHCGKKMKHGKCPECDEAEDEDEKK
jgi:hypothetical protein